MKTDSPTSAPPQPEDLPVLPRKRKWFGYAAVAVSLAITCALWLGAMGAADEWYDNPWKYPAKVGSHGTLILMCWAFLLAARLRPLNWLFGGLDKVYKAHRHIGESAFFLIFLHPVFLAVAHADSVSAFLQYLWFSGNWVRNTGLIALAIFSFSSCSQFMRRSPTTDGSSRMISSVLCWS